VRKDEIILDIEGGSKLRFVLTDFGLRVTADGNEVDIADLLPYSDIFKRRGIIYEVIHSKIDLSDYTDVAKRCLWQYDEETTQPTCSVYPNQLSRDKGYSMLFMAHVSNH